MGKFKNAMKATGHHLTHTDLADIGHGVAHVTTAAVDGTRTKAHEVAQVRQLLKLRKEAQEARAAAEAQAGQAMNVDPAQVMALLNQLQAAGVQVPAFNGSTVIDTTAKEV